MWFLLVESRHKRGLAWAEGARAEENCGLETARLKGVWMGLKQGRGGFVVQGGKKEVEVGVGGREEQVVAAEDVDAMARAVAVLLMVVEGLVWSREAIVGESSKVMVQERQENGDR